MSLSHFHPLAHDVHPLSTMFIAPPSSVIPTGAALRGEVEGPAFDFRVRHVRLFRIWKPPRLDEGRTVKRPRWRREKKLALVERLNPCWIDLAEEWYR